MLYSHTHPCLNPPFPPHTSPAATPKDRPRVRRDGLQETTPTAASLKRVQGVLLTAVTGYIAFSTAVIKTSSGGRHPRSLVRRLLQPKCRITGGVFCITFTLTFSVCGLPRRWTLTEVFVNGRCSTCFAAVTIIYSFGTSHTFLASETMKPKLRNGPQTSFVLRYTYRPEVMEFILHPWRLRRYQCILQEGPSIRRYPPPPLQPHSLFVCVFYCPRPSVFEPWLLSSPVRWPPSALPLSPTCCLNIACQLIIMLIHKSCVK